MARWAQAVHVAQRQAIVDGIHQALVKSVGMLVEELRNLVADHDEMRQQAGYKGRGYAKIASKLEENAGMARNDFFIFMLKRITLTGRLVVANLPWPLRSSLALTLDAQPAPAARRALPCACVPLPGAEESFLNLLFLQCLVLRNSVRCTAWASALKKEVFAFDD